MIVNIDGQKFDLSPATLEGILEAEQLTKEDTLEHGFSLCDTPKGIVPGEKCTGNECSIYIQPCSKEVGPDAGSFHSHPDVISFSLKDYILAAVRAIDHPEHKGLMCVALKDQGIRCKALVEQPPTNLLNQLYSMLDGEDTRALIKPFFTERVSVSNANLKALLAGVPWEALPASETVCAIDEGPEQMLGNITCPEEEITMAKTLIQVAQEYIKEPSGQYPWETKQVTKSVKHPGGGVGIEAAGMPDLISKETKFIRTSDVEIPDPDLIHIGEVAGYIAALSPIILSDTKDKDGKYKIHDGRHRVAAWRAAGYKQIPVVFTHEVEYKPK